MCISSLLVLSFVSWTQYKLSIVYPKDLQKILIRAPRNVAMRLEEKLRHRFDVVTEFIDLQSICEISARLKNKTVIICRFAADEDFKNILTMFEVNYEIKRH